MKKIISKTEYLEWVSWNSVYWISNVSHWKLYEDDEHWLVSFDHLNYEFERLLNGYKLREKLRAQTGQVRISIIEHVLRSIDSRLAE